MVAATMEHLDLPNFASVGDILARLGAAAALAAVLGLDRELRNKPVGLRSFILVAVGAASFCMITMEVYLGLEQDLDLALDPSRTIEGIIGGIGFLGAGAIIQQRGRVLGATTGACIWTTGAIGVACGFGLYEHAVALTVVAALALTVLGLVERHLGIKQTVEDDR